MFVNLRTGLGWLRFAVAWQLIEGSLEFYRRQERRFGKLLRLGDRAWFR